MVFRLAASASPGDLFKVQICRIHRGLLNQKLWEKNPAICVFISLLGDSDARLILKIPGLGYP